MSQATPATSRHARAIRILMCLQSGPRFNAKRLAKHLQVSRRTIHRDLDLIRRAGIEITYDETHEAYRLVSQLAQPLGPELQPSDLTTLVLTSHLSLLQGFPEFSSAAREALSKLMTNYPDDVRTTLSRLLNACIVRTNVEAYSDNALSVMRTIFKGISLRKQVRMVVHGGEYPQPVQTKVAPYRVVMAVNEWMVVGRSSLHRCTRAFNIHAVREADLTDDEYEVPRGFEVFS